MDALIVKVFSDQLESVAAAAHITRQWNFNWLDQKVYATTHAAREGLSTIERHEVLVEVIHRYIYSYFYCPGEAVQVAPAPAPNRHSKFAEALIHHNHGSGTWSPGWLIEEADGAVITISKGALKLGVKARDRSLLRGTSLGAGVRVEARFPAELPAMSPGYVMMLGNQPLPEDSGERLVRLYWNINPHGVLLLVHYLTSILNDTRGVPFHLKALRDPDCYPGRCDTLVLYVRAVDYMNIVDVLAEVYNFVAEDVQPRIPAFTKQLAAGVGLAEDPGGGDSFGLSRSRLVAEALVSAREEGANSVGQRVESIRRHFEMLDLRSDAPYLSSDSVDAYPCLPAAIIPVTAGAKCCYASACSTEGNGSADLMYVVDAIAQDIMDSAILAGAQCTWLAPQKVDIVHGERHAGIHKTIGVDLLGGTSGIALFLLAHHLETGDERSRETALAAISHALAGAVNLPSTADLGFYTGRVGVAVAAATLGLGLEVEQIVNAALVLIDVVVGRYRASPQIEDFALLSGAAGAIAGLIRLGRMLGGDVHLDVAESLGSRLIAAARESQRGGWLWESHTGSSCPCDVIGFAQGSAGIGYALAELAAKTGDNRYKVAAGRAFAVETTGFSVRLDQQSDQRVCPQAVHGNTRRPCVSDWRHGSAGMALARLKAGKLWGDAVVLGEARVGCRATKDALSANLAAAEMQDMSLCYGMAGRAGALTMAAASPAMGGKGSELSTLARLVAERARRDLSAFPRAWSPGPTWIRAPGLMTGATGLGLFLLSAVNPATPSVLLPADCDSGL